MEIQQDCVGMAQAGRAEWVLDKQQKLRYCGNLPCMLRLPVGKSLSNLCRAYADCLLIE